MLLLLFFFLLISSIITKRLGISPDVSEWQLIVTLAQMMYLPYASNVFVAFQKRIFTDGELMINLSLTAISSRVGDLFKSNIFQFFRSEYPNNLERAGFVSKILIQNSVRIIPIGGSSKIPRNRVFISRS